MSIWSDQRIKELLARVTELERQMKLLQEGANVQLAAQQRQPVQQERQTLGARR